jgi:hypothetical protein
VIGNFCEKLHPHLAFVAYKHARRVCDAELVKVATENGLFEDLARYLVDELDLKLWRKVLMSSSTEGRTAIIQALLIAKADLNLQDEVRNGWCCKRVTTAYYLVWDMFWSVASIHV